VSGLIRPRHATHAINDGRQNRDRAQNRERIRQPAQKISGPRAANDDVIIMPIHAAHVSAGFIAALTGSACTRAINFNFLCID
jgi:hypothetical protein